MFRRISGNYPRARTVAAVLRTRLNVTAAFKYEIRRAGSGRVARDISLRSKVDRDEPDARAGRRPFSILRPRASRFAESNLGEFRKESFPIRRSGSSSLPGISKFLPSFPTLSPGIFHRFPGTSRSRSDKITGVRSRRTYRWSRVNETKRAIAIEANGIPVRSQLDKTSPCLRYPSRASKAGNPQRDTTETLERHGSSNFGINPS